MVKRQVRTLGRGRVLDFVAAVGAALALAAVGLSEVAWTPFSFLAASPATPGRGLGRFRRKAARP